MHNVLPPKQHLPHGNGELCGIEICYPHVMHSSGMKTEVKTECQVELQWDVAEDMEDFS